MRLLTVLLIASSQLGVFASTVRGELVAYLTESRQAGPDAFESDLFFVAAADLVGARIELISLDIGGSTVARSPLTDYAHVTFIPAPTFDAWADELPFGIRPGFESRISLDAYAAPAAVTYEIGDRGPFQVGTFRFDYGGITLHPGETIRLDISGRDDGSASRTTSVAVRGSDQVTRLVDPQFTSPLGSSVAEYPVVLAIPEPAIAQWLLAVAAITASWPRRRPRIGRSETSRAANVSSHPSG